MSKLSDLPNIGKHLEQTLMAVDVTTAEDLRSLGSREAFRRIRHSDDTACLNKLYALEGAVQGVRWHFLPEAEKKVLKDFMQSLKSR